MRTLILLGLLTLAACADVPISGARALSATTTEDGVQLTWSLGESPGTEQWIERRPARGKFERIASLAADTTSFVDRQAARGVEYVYRVLSLSDGVPWNGTYSRQVTAARP
jgi:hypothetical protein